jgi:23S rRNA (uracil1939-C5)-methyltransferase
VRVRLRQLKPRWARGELLEVLDPSPDRVQPACRHFGSCGGCQWQHIAVARQRSLKAEIVRGQLRFLGQIDDPPVAETLAVGSADGFGYRNHVSFAIDASGRACLRRGNSHELIAIEECPQLHPLLRESLRALPPLPGAEGLELRCTRSGERVALLRGDTHAEAEHVATERGVPLERAGEAELNEVIAGQAYRISSKSFFQANSDGADALVQQVLAWLDPQEGELIGDFYAGVGLFAVPLARRGARVCAVENHPAALRDLRRNARGLSIQIVGQPVEAAGSELPERLDKLVADPPREGLSPAAVALLASLRARRIALVGCDPAALARDVRALMEAGYVLRQVQPIDLFPHTYHIEAVAWLQTRR